MEERPRPAPRDCSRRHIGTASSIAIVLLLAIAPAAWAGIGVKSIASGIRTNCAVLTNGTVKCWGDNSRGQLGANKTAVSYSTVPVDVVTSTSPGASLTDATQVSVGKNHGCARLADGTARCWGDNSYGQLGTGSTSPYTSYYGLTVRDTAGNAVAGIEEIRVGSQNTCARFNDGSLSCWGATLGSTPSSFLVPSSSTGGAGWACLMSPSYTCRVSPLAVGGITDAIAIAMGPDYACLRTSAGTIRCLGGNSAYQFGNGSSTSSTSPQSTSMGAFTGGSPISLAAGGRTTCAIAPLSPTAGLYCWGDNSYKQQGNGSSGASSVPGLRATAATSDAVAVGSTTVCRTASGAIRCAGDDTGTVNTRIVGTSSGNGYFVTPNSISDARNISVGEGHACALRQAGSIACWGDNTYGQLGNGTTTTRTAPDYVAVNGLGLAIPSLSGAPAGLSNSRTATIGFSGDADTTFKCALDGASASDCSSPLELTGLADGSHSLTVTQSDSAGNSTDSSASWSVDATAPDAPGLSGTPSALTGSKAASIAVSAENGATLNCAIDGGTAQPCSSPVTLADLEDGSHSISITQTDAAGNEGPAAVASWTVDTTAPAAPTLGGAPSGLTRQTSASVSITGESGATFSCSVDNGAWSACQSPKVLSSLGDGAHVLSVKATDAAGNEGPAASASWSIDATAPPAPTLAGTPASPTRSSSATISIAGEAGTTFRCSVDGRAATVCVSPLTLTGLADGSHSVSVSQTDAAGNTGPAAAVDWTVDTVAPPAPTFSTRPAAATSSMAAAFAFSASSDPVFSCSLDGGPASKCTSPTSVKVSADGVHAFTVSHADAAGNSSSASVSWILDRTAPAFTSSPVKPKSKTSKQVTYSLGTKPDLSGVRTVEYSTATAKPSQSAKPVTTRTVTFATPLVIKTSSTVRWLRLADAAGNLSAWTKAS